MRVVSSTGREEVAVAYVAETAAGRLVEFTEAVQPPLTRDRKWVLIVSSLYGCPVRCAICDAGDNYEGKMSASEILEQIDFLVEGRYPDRRVPSEKFKIQFARVGEPSLNMAVLDVLSALPHRYDAPGLMPSVSSVAPAGCNAFFEGLRDIKNRLYGRGRFQLQFSIHTTDESLRDRLIPIRKWGLARIGRYGTGFRGEGDRKVTLNFALARGTPVDPDVLLHWFDPEDFLVKITPINPTHRAVVNGIVSHVEPGREEAGAEIERLRAAGYEVLLSIGELEENRIGSNCGQYIQTHLASRERLGDGYACVDAAAPAAEAPGGGRERRTGAGRGE